MDSKKVAKIFVDVMELVHERAKSITPEEERRINLRLAAEQIKIRQRIEDEIVKRGVK